MGINSIFGNRRRALQYYNTITDTLPGKGTIEFQSERRCNVKSAVFYGDCIQADIPSPESPQPILSNNSAWAVNGTNLWNFTGITTRFMNLDGEYSFTDNVLVGRGKVGTRTKSYSTGSAEMKMATVVPAGRYIVSFNVMLLDQGQYSNEIRIHVTDSNGEVYEQPPLDFALYKNRYVQCLRQINATNGIWSVMVYMNNNKLQIDFGSLKLYADNTQRIDLSGIKLYGVGDTRDEFDSATGKLTRRCARIASYNGQSVGDSWISSTGALTTGAEVVYVLPTPTVTYTTPQPISQIAGNNTLQQISGNIHNTRADITYYSYGTRYINPIKNWEQLGNLIKSGLSTYYISAGDKIDVNWIKSVNGTTTHGRSVVCTDIWKFTFGVGEAEAKDYYFVYDGSNWTYNEAVINLSDFALTVDGTIEAGEVMTITTAVTPVNFTFTAYDKFESNETSVPHNWVLEETYAQNAKVYDTYEALFVLDEGYTLPSGKYKLHQRYYGTRPFIDVYLTISQEFTATDGIMQFASTGKQNVACIPGSETKYYIASNIRPVYKNSNTYLAPNITIQYNQTGDDWVDISTVEGVRITSAQIQAALGNNCPAYSNLRQHLNDESANGTYVATHDFDRPSAYNFQKGYLYGIDPRVYALILPTKTKFMAGYNNGEYTRGTTYENVDKVFLLSMKEMSYDIQTSEGNVTDLYGKYTGNVLTNVAVAARAKYNKAEGTLNSGRWSRSCDSSLAYRSCRVSSSGGHDSSNNANSAEFFAAAFMLGKKSGNQ